jgi:hypothetical protein
MSTDIDFIFVIVTTNPSPENMSKTQNEII